MSRFGTGGSVKLCMDVRIAEKWEGFETLDGSFMASNSWWLDGPKTGPLGSASVGGSGLSFGSTSSQKGQVALAPRYILTVSRLHCAMRLFFLHYL